MESPEPGSDPFDPFGGERSPSASGTAAPAPSQGDDGAAEGGDYASAPARHESGEFSLTGSGEFAPPPPATGRLSAVPPPASHQSGEWVPPPATGRLVAVPPPTHQSGELAPNGEVTHRSGEYAPPPAHQSGEFTHRSGEHAPATGRQRAVSHRSSRDGGDRHSARLPHRERSGRRRSHHSRAPTSDRGKITKIGPYHLLKRIGKGSHGYVYLARREGERKQVALKVLRTRMLKHKEALQRFRREAELAGKLDHPGVLKVLESGEEGEHQLWYAMEYCAGHTLQEYLQRLPMDPDKARKLVAKLARTVAFAHEQGVIHRDLKPSNILLDPESNMPRITDFGLAKDRWEDSELTQAGEQIGTPIYMSPEQFRGQDVDHRADIYSLGVVLYECLTGRPPYEAATTPEVAKLVLAGNAVPPSTSVPGIPKTLEAICLKAMSKEWVSRYAKASELADALEDAGDDDDDRRIGLIPLAITMTFVGLAAGIVGWSYFSSPGRRDLLAEVSPQATPRVSNPTPDVTPSVDPQVALDRRATEKLTHAKELARAMLPFEETLTAFRLAVQAAQHDPLRRAQAELAQAEFLFRRGKLDACNRAAAVLAQQRPPIGTRARYLAALSDLWRDRRQLALTSLERLHNDDPSGLDGLLAGALLKLEQGDPERGQKLARDAINLEADDAEGWITLAACLRADRHGRRGLQAVERALDLVPDHPRAYLVKAEILREERRTDQAFNAYSRVIALTEPEPLQLALRRRAALACDLDDNRQAILDTRALIQRDPLDVEARLWQGVAYDQKGEPGKALESWRLAHDVEQERFEQLLQQLNTRRAVRIRAALLGND